MTRIAAVRHALPEHWAPQATVREIVAALFPADTLRRHLTVFDHCRVDQRRFMRPLPWYLEPRTAAERNRVYLEEGMQLLLRAGRDCLQAAGVAPAEIDHVIAVSSTGHATPTLDARLIAGLDLRPTATRLPIWGLGCAGGAAGLARAFDYCRAHPRATVLLTALECCSLTFQPGDQSLKNLIAAALFADGAPAVLIKGAEISCHGPRLVATGSHLFPDSDRIMGWDFGDEGMRLVLSPRLPALIRQELPGLVDRFLADRGLGRKQLSYYLTHPGGPKVLRAFAEALGLEAQALALSTEALHRYGNISSVSVLMVLEEWLRREESAREGYGLLSAFGPGFSAELVLLGD